MSQKSDVLAHLKTGKSITSIEALNLFQAFRLADIVFKLRKDGVPIKTETVGKGSKSWAKYSLGSN